MRKPNPDLEKVHIFLDKLLVEDLKKAYPELRGLTYSGAVDFAVRRAVLTADAGRVKTVEAEKNGA